MSLTDLIGQDAIIASLKASSKKQVIQEMAEVAASITNLPVRLIFEQLLQRERLGSTGIGHGIAIPHARINGIYQIAGVFARLDRPIEFDAVDDEPVDLVFMLLAPEGEGADHLKALARIARVLRDPENTGKLRASRDAGAIYGVLNAPATSNAA
ncbi:PTS IIA-like nitrogen regulatory protein PtsN [Tepidamorphus sp. 3E244]|uniref:PTS IIA-like nitrogen regulatory protein PtsN n=1 Tax=Tepidamorphus sp. 3E244 TaxID=3385498 RepID=UPI0038FCF6C1